MQALDADKCIVKGHNASSIVDLAKYSSGVERVYIIL